MVEPTVSISTEDRNRLRELAKQVAEIGSLPVQQQRIELWKKHNSLQPVRPMILVFPEGSWGELLPRDTMQCESRHARGIEWQLRSRLYYHEHFDDDTVIENTWTVPAVVHDSGWGLQARHIDSDAVGGAWAFDPVINEPADLKKIRFPEINYDEEATQRNLAFARDLFGDILEVRPKKVSRLCFHLMAQYTGWRGLEQVLMDMVTDPDWVHDAMELLTQGHLQRIQQHVDQNLLSLNNDNTYNNSGGNGWTDELPAEGFDPDRVRQCDCWSFAESQEFAVVGPDMHREFAMQYEARLLAGWGLTGYGCCDAPDQKLPDIFELLPNIRRISIAPSAKVETCAPQMKGDYIFSWKPQPAHLVGRFDDEHVRGYIRNTIEVCREHGCVLEMVLKDTHTCERHPERFDRWTRIAREEVNRAVE